jgi:hypothetical protein
MERFGAPRPPNTMGTHATGEAAALEQLARRGFIDGFRVVDDNLQALMAGKVLQPNELVIREVYRFEGVSDPDDMAVVYALASTTGVQGTLVDAFGVYADPAKSAVLAKIPWESAARPTRAT